MPRLTPEQRAELERQLADDDAAADDFEIEIRDGDKATRIPYSRGRSWLQEHFGIDLPATPEEPEEPDDKQKGGKVVQGRGFGKAPYARRTG